MAKTREKILSTTLNLFNTRGLAKVKLRTIADEMGISQGNLNYHFKKRNELIEALYFELVDGINNKMRNQVVAEKPSLEQLMLLGNAVMTELLKFRFIMLDFVQIMRENELIRNHFKELQKIRQEQFMFFFNSLEKQGIMRKALIPNEYLNLYKRLQLIGDFWIASATIDSNKISKKVMEGYVELINQTIFPYLTKEGQEEYYEISR